MNLTKYKLTAELWCGRQPIRHANVRVARETGRVDLSVWCCIGYQRHPSSRDAHQFEWVVRRPDGSVFDRRHAQSWVFAYEPFDRVLRRTQIDHCHRGFWPLDQALMRLGYDCFRTQYFEELPPERFEELMADPTKRITDADRWWRRSA